MSKLTKAEKRYLELHSENLLSRLTILEESIEDFRSGEINIDNFKNILDIVSEDTIILKEFSEYLRFKDSFNEGMLNLKNYKANRFIAEEDDYE